MRLGEILEPKISAIPILNVGIDHQARCPRWRAEGGGGEGIGE